MNGPQQYDVFISYAHADAKKPEQKALIETIKTRIEEALQSVSAYPFVFLDSEALRMGMEWESKIRESIRSCRVFIYLLSPNYLKSDYCQRERLWWAQKEIKKGHLNKGTCPIYYIHLNKDGDPRSDQYRRECRLIQADDTKPFFESLEQIRLDVVKDRIQSVANDICGQIGTIQDIKASFCSVYPRISKYFVGRLEDLMLLNAKTFEYGTIPVISAGPGVGKTELAVAYAYAYAENFPQGRFLIPMEGITSWAEAMGKLVEWCGAYAHTPPENLGLPENFNKLSPEQKKDATYRMLATRAKKGALLLLLDNLEDLNLISDFGLDELTGGDDLPDDLHIIATTRLNEKAHSTLAVKTQIEIKNLKEDDAFELFCKMGNNIFPFAKYPMDGGKLLLDYVEGNRRISAEKQAEIEQEYAALKELIRVLGGHAWSLEIVAGRLIANLQSLGRSNVQTELDKIKANPLENLSGKTRRGSATNPEFLLQPTLDLIMKQDELVAGGELGQKMMRLAEAASFFPPDQVPEYALRGIGEQLFGDEEISWEQNGIRLTGKSLDYALTQLIKYRIFDGEDDMLKMHRLTREILHKRMSEERKLETVRSMQKYLSVFLEDTPNPTSRQILPWCGWAEECLNMLGVLREDAPFLEKLLDLASNCMEMNLHAEAKSILTCEPIQKTSDIKLKSLQLFYKGYWHSDLEFFPEAEALFQESLALSRKLTAEEPEKPFDYMIANNLNSLAFLHHTLNRNREAEKEYAEALAIRRKLAEKNQEKYLPEVATSLNNLANLHSDLNHNGMAEKEYAEALNIQRELAKKTPEKYLPHVSITLNNLANLHNDLNRYREAEKEHEESLSISRELAEKTPEKFLSDVVIHLNNLAFLHKELNRYKEAEKEFEESLNISRELAEKTPEKFLLDVSLALHNLALLHRNLNRYGEAENEYTEALDIQRKLAEKAPEKYLPKVAITLNNLAHLHKNLNRNEEAENEYTEALGIQRKLAEKNPEMFLSNVAITLNSFAGLHKKLDRNEEAEKEYAEALDIRRKLTEKIPEKFLTNLAITLNDLASLHSDLNRNEEAEKEYKESLSISRKLAEKAPEKFLPDVAITLTNLAILHKKLNRCEEAEIEYAEALEIRRELAEKIPEKFLPDVAMALTNLAALHYRLDRFDESEKEYAGALALYRKLAEKSPEMFLPDVAMTLNDFAVLHKELNRCEDAEKEYAEALALYRKLAEKDPGRVLPDVAITLTNLADLHKELGRFDESEKEYVEVQDLYRKLAEKDPGRFLGDRAKVLNTLALMYHKLNRCEEAENEHAEALALYRKLAERDPEKFLPKVALTLNNLAILHKELGRDKKSEKKKAEALALYRKLAEQDPQKFLPDLVMTLNSLAALHKELGRYKKAEKEKAEALAIQRKLAEITLEKDDSK